MIANRDAGWTSVFPYLNSRIRLDKNEFSRSSFEQEDGVKKP
jgi:hypothetical protein